MISARELAFGMIGAWRLVRNDASGKQYFDRSEEGALRSFWVMVLLAPAFMLLILLDLSAIAHLGMRQVIVIGLIYVVDWLLFPVLIMHLAPRLDRTRQFPGYVAAYNWSQIFNCAIFLFTSSVGGFLSDKGHAILISIGLGAAALIAYRMLRQMMELQPAPAALLTFAGISLSRALSLLLQYLVVGTTAAA